MIGLEVMKMEKQIPVKRFRAGPVSAALWENRISTNGRTAILFKATIARNFKDRNGQWHATESFTRDEVAPAVHVLQCCYAAMVDRQELSSNSAVTEEEIAA